MGRRRLDFFRAKTIASSDGSAALVPEMSGPIVHVRVREQLKDWPLEDLERDLREFAAKLQPFPGCTYDKIIGIVDWDHQLPSQQRLIRVLATHDARQSEILDTAIAERQRAIAEENLYPEFDVADFDALPADEVYSAAQTRGAATLHELRFSSLWRDRVESSLSRATLRALRESEAYQRALDGCDSAGVTLEPTLGSTPEDQRSTRSGRSELAEPVMAGWAAPCVAGTEHWAIEYWVLTAFEGEFGRGKARVFFVDSVDLAVGRQFDMDVQVQLS